MGKLLLSGILAFLFLTAFCYLYYNIPVHSENSDGSTDYKWEPNVFYSRGTEGFAWGRTNNEGFTDTFDYYDDMQIDVLVMGSSHMEGFQVALEESTAGQLNQLLGNQTVYNIGVSGHNFITCCSNLEAALEKYHPAIVVLETGNTLFSDDALSNAINGTVSEIPSHTGGIVGILQQNPYLRLLYGQIQNYRGKQVAEIDDADSQSVDTSSKSEKNNEELLNALCQKIERIASDHDTIVIIVYHPGTAINSNGSLRLTGSINATNQFAAECDENHLYFLNMGNHFLSEYDNTYRLPYGFINTSVGSGHLNRYGHAMIANDLYKLIMEVE